MADPSPSRTTGKWLWPVLIALLAIITLIWLFSPSGDREGEVGDPIVTGELAEPAGPDAQEIDIEADAAAEAAAGRTGTTTTTEPAPAPAGQ